MAAETETKTTQEEGEEEIPMIEEKKTGLVAKVKPFKGSATALSEDKDPKQLLNTFMQKFCNRMLVKGEISYSLNKVADTGKYQATVTLKCCDSQVFAGEACDEAQEAQKEAAKMALSNFAEDLEKVRADPNCFKHKSVPLPSGVRGRGNNFTEVPAGKRAKGGTAMGDFQVVPAKSLLNMVCSKMLKATMSKDEIIYTATAVEGGGYKCTLKLPCLPGDLATKEWEGSMKRGVKDAEHSAAEAALESLREDPETADLIESLDLKVTGKMNGINWGGQNWEWGWKSSGKGKPSFLLDMYYGPGGKGEGQWPTDEKEQEAKWAEWSSWFGPPKKAPQVEEGEDEDEDEENKPKRVAVAAKLTQRERRHQAAQNREAAGGALPQAIATGKIAGAGIAALPMPVTKGRVSKDDLPAPMAKGVIKPVSKPNTSMQTGGKAMGKGAIREEIAVGAIGGAKIKPRIKLTVTPVTGEVLEWSGSEGLIKPHAPLTHAMASKRSGNVFFALADITDAPGDTPDWLKEGAIVQFQAYADTSGLGAEAVASF